MHFRFCVFAHFPSLYLCSVSTLMAALLFLGLVFAMAGSSRGANWCVCKKGLSDQILQKTLDYACGAGADCYPLHLVTACLNPNTVRRHCSYAANSYFQKRKQAPGACDFSGTAHITTDDPSTSSTCYYAATDSAASTTKSPSTTSSSGTMNPSITTNSKTPFNGIGTGVGPYGAGINPDSSHGGIRVWSTSLCFFARILFSGLVFL